jgi:hypothetical protein
VARSASSTKRLEEQLASLRIPTAAWSLCELEMMQDSGADNSASAKKALAKAQRVLQIVATKRSAIALRDLRETLEVRGSGDATCGRLPTDWAAGWVE